MNILIIMLKELKQNLRDKKALSMMVLFPIVLMVILGMALSGAFEGTKVNMNTKVIYTTSESGNITKGFDNLIGGLKDIGVQFYKSDSTEEGLNSVKDTKYSCYINIDEAKGTIELYKNERYNFSANLIESSLNSFIDKYNMYSEVAKVNPIVLNEITKETNRNLVKSVSLEKKREPRAKDYYSITMLTLIIMYGSLTASYAITSERVRKTNDRILGSPAKRHEYFIGKLLGCVLVTVLQVVIVVLFSKYILKAYWGDNIWIIFAIVLSEIIMSISIGLGVGFLIKNESTASGLLNGIIPVLVLFGGGYFPLEQFRSSIISGISRISPLRWINDSIFRVIYSNDYSLVGNAVAINLAVAVVLVILSSMKLRREVA